MNFAEIFRTAFIELPSTAACVIDSRQQFEFCHCPRIFTLLNNLTQFHPLGRKGEILKLKLLLIFPPENLIESKVKIAIQPNGVQKIVVSRYSTFRKGTFTF